MDESTKTPNSETANEGGSLQSTLTEIVMPDFSKIFRDLGWSGGNKPHHSGATLSWYKRYKTHTRCQCNNEKAGMQIVVYWWDMRQLGHNLDSFEIELCGETSDHEWVAFKVYSIPGNRIFEVLDNQIKKLLSAWEAINKKH